MQNRHVIDEYLGLLLLDHLLLQVKSCTFKEHSGDVPAILGLGWHFGDIRLLSDLGVDGQLVKFQSVLFAELLGQRYHLRVRNVDSGQPRDIRFALDPFVLLFDTFL